MLGGVKPVTVTTLPAPIAAFAKLAIGLPPGVKLSPLASPTKAAVPVSVAAVVPSYARFTAESPATVSAFDVMLAVAVGAPVRPTPYGPASAPPSDTAVIATALPVPTADDWKANVAEAMVTVCPPFTPISVSPPVVPLADVVPS